MSKIAKKTHPKKWKAAVREARARMGGHSAHAMQFAVKLYKDAGGGYSGDKPSASDNSMRKWTKQKWAHSGGDKPGKGGKGVYLPEDKIKRLKSTKQGRRKLALASKIKNRATKQGKQYSRHGLAAGTSLKEKKKNA